MYMLAIVTLALLGIVTAEDYANNTSVQRFRQYVQINTTTNNDLTEAVNFWTQLAEEEGVDIVSYEFTTGYPVLVIKWPGTNSSISSIMLNSHMDVVPAVESDGWTYPPFSAYLDDDGVIWGRGTQDMKSVGIQYFEAMKDLKDNNITLLRDVYMTIMPDEETGGENGMIKFLASEEFAALNVGLELDEGASSNVPISPLFYQDKSVWQFQVDCYGEATHSSTLPAINSTAIGQCYNVMTSMLQYREEQYEISLVATEYNAGLYTNLNLNICNGGTANNIIASHVYLIFDMRLGTSVNETEMEEKLNDIVASAGDNVTLTFILKNPQTPATIVNSTNPYFTTFYKATTESSFPIYPLVSPGSTDARYVRGAGIPAFGFSPMPNTDLLLHSVNERLDVLTFLNGITVYKRIIQGIANLASGVISTDPSVYLEVTAL